MNENRPLEIRVRDRSLLARIDPVCDAFERDWKGGRRPKIEVYLENAAESDRLQLLEELLHQELDYRHKLGEKPALEEYLGRFAKDELLVRGVFSQFVLCLSAETSEAPTINHDPLPETQLQLLEAQADQANGTSSNQTEALLPVIPGYRVLEFVSKGGMGVVYKALHCASEQIVALKVIRPDKLELMSAEELQRTIERFRIEARAAARLEHEGIVGVRDVGEIAGRPYYTMRYIKGTSLHELVKNGHPMEARRAAAYLEQVARAVHEAHQHGILHRDLKPHNVLLEEATDRPLVADFGLAKLAERGRGPTLSGEFMGTPPYTPPEQVRSSAHVTVASDVYSLGATLYELITGYPPFDGPTPVDICINVLEKDPLPPRMRQPSLPRDLEVICLKCLEKEPRKRYANAKALAEDLRRFLEMKPIMARPVSPWDRGIKWVRRHPTLAALLSIMAIALCAFMSAITWFNGQLESALTESNLRGDQARLSSYVSDMKRARIEMDSGNERRVLELLRKHQPKQGEKDLRGFEWYYLARVCDKRHLTLSLVDLSAPPPMRRTDRVRGATFSRDGKYIAAAGESGIKVWDSATGHELRDLPPPLELSQWELIAVRRPPPLPFRGIAFSPDGQRIASPRADGEVDVRDANRNLLFDLKLQGPTAGGPGAICTLFTLDGTGIITTKPNPDDIGQLGGRGLVQVWDTRDGKLLHSFTSHSPAADAVLSRDGNQVALAGQGIEVLWLRDGKLFMDIRAYNEFGERLSISSVAFSPDGSRLVSVATDGTVQAWDYGVASAPSLQTLRSNPLYTVRFPLRSTWLSISPDGRRLGAIAVNYEWAVKLWDIASVSPIYLDGPKYYRCLAFDPNGNIASAPGHGGLVICDVRTGQELESLPIGASRATFSPDGQRIALAQPTSRIAIWDLRARKKVVDFQGHEAFIDVIQMVFSPDGEHIVSADRKRTVKVWDAATGQERFSLKLPTDVGSVAFSQDGTRIAVVCLGAVDGTPAKANSGEFKREVRFWNATTGQELLAVTLETDNNRGVAFEFSPDSKLLAVTGCRVPFRDNEPAGNEVELFEVSTGHRLSTLRGHVSGVESMAFSPDGQRLASVASGENKLRIWCVESGEEVCSLELPRQSVQARMKVAFSPDGLRIGVFGTDHTIVWDATPTAPGSEGNFGQDPR